MLSPRPALITALISATLALLLSAAACKKPKDATNPVAPIATAERPAYSYAQANDIRVAPQFVKGWYGVEDGAWRWMAKESVTVLKSPKTFPAQFEVRFTLPKGTMTTVGGPVTFTVLIDDKPLAEETYTQDGNYILQKNVPPGMVGPDPLHVTLRVNKTKAPVPGGDVRELGAVIEGLGFK